MNKPVLLFIMLATIGWSCKKAPDEQRARVVDAVSQDTLLKQYVAATFNLHGHYWEEDFQQYIKLEARPQKEIIIYPGQYKLRSSQLGDWQRYAPFAVKVTSASDSLITFFSFSDELYYLYNNNRARLNRRDKVIEYRDTTHERTDLTKFLNLEKNLNALIVKLNYQHDREAIINLLQVVFCDLLRMREVSYEEVEAVIAELKAVKRSSKLKLVITEYESLQKKSGEALCLHTKEGRYGYWTFTVDTQSVPTVKVRFVGDLLYYSIYM